jgi:rhodanese-related sulfurtransferase
MFGLFSKEAKAYENLRGAEFKRRFDTSAGAVLVDVRTAMEFSSGTIRGSKNIDVMNPSFKDQFAKLDKEKEYFLFCRSGGRSEQACQLLAREGYRVFNLAGGIGSWPRT